MNKTETIKKFSAEKKTALCILLSMFYLAMLAYPFGVAMEGYVWQKAVLAAVVLFALSIPAWIINLKREFYDGTQTEGTVEDVLENELDLSSTINYNKFMTLGELAQMERWLTSEEIAQIRFCQDGEPGSTFGEIAVKRNFLTPQQVAALEAMQTTNH